MDAKLKNSRPIWVDPDDAPEITDEWIESADLYHGNKLIRLGRPSTKHKAEEDFSVCLSSDIVGRFRASGPGWQERMNTVLANWLKRHSPEELSI